MLALSKVLCHPAGRFLHTSSAPSAPPSCTQWPRRTLAGWGGLSLPNMLLLRVLPSALKVAVAALPKLAISAPLRAPFHPSAVNHLLLVSDRVNYVFPVQMTGVVSAP